MTRLSRSRLSKRNEMNKNRYKHFSQPVNTKNMRMHMYKLQLIFITWLWACLVRRDGTDFTHTQKYIIEPARYRDIFST